MTLRRFYECDRGHQIELVGDKLKSNTTVRCNTCGADARLTLVVSQYTEKPPTSD